MLGHIAAAQTDLFTGQAKDKAMLDAIQRAKLSNAEMAEMKKVAEDFESVFLAQMMQPMFDSVEKNELTHGGYGEDVFQSMMVEEYGKQISASGGIGLADHIMKQMIQLQEVAA